jgi:hypothetical protein
MHFDDLEPLPAPAEWAGQTRLLAEAASTATSGRATVSTPPAFRRPKAVQLEAGTEKENEPPPSPLPNSQRGPIVAAMSWVFALFVESFAAYGQAMYPGFWIKSGSIDCVGPAEEPPRRKRD